MYIAVTRVSRCIEADAACAIRNPTVAAVRPDKSFARGVQCAIAWVALNLEGKAAGIVCSSAIAALVAALTRMELLGQFFVALDHAVVLDLLLLLRNRTTAETTGTCKASTDNKSQKTNKRKQT